MAAEIRDLENQLYEYDHEYKLLEQKIQTLQQQNAALMANSTATNRQKSSAGSSSRKQPLEFPPRTQPSPVPPQPRPEPEQLKPARESILEGAPPKPPAEPESLPPPALPETRVNPTLPSLPPATGPGLHSPGSGPSLAPETLPPTNSTPSLTPGGPPSGVPPQTSPPSRLPQFPKSTPDNDFDLDSLTPPTIDPGIPSPPPLPDLTRDGQGQPVAPENSLELSLSQVEVPALAAPTRLASATSSRQATIQLATEKVTDLRVVELAFHPTLSRAIDMDDRPDDDGLYLVLQPKNEIGQMVPVAADLTIIVLDPAREGAAAKIGRWEYPAADVQAKLQPIGIEQGIHFRLPWNGPDPAADRVIVFALYKFADGRQVMGEKEIFISSDGSHKTVWTPRTAPADRELPAVAPASFQTEAEMPDNGLNDSTRGVAHFRPLVRPASGSSTHDPAPQP